MARIHPKRTLPLLKLRVASPCTASWENMKGDERVRFCGQCEKQVYNLSAMSLGEATELLLAKNDGLCVRMFQRPDGTVMTEDCPVGVRRKWVRRVATTAAAGALLAAEALSVASARKTARCQALPSMEATLRHGEVTNGDARIAPADAPAVMGSVVMPPPPPPPNPPVMGGLRGLTPRPIIGHIPLRAGKQG
jgi:hypothetical protein